MCQLDLLEHGEKFFYHISIFQVFFPEIRTVCKKITHIWKKVDFLKSCKLLESYINVYRKSSASVMMRMCFLRPVEPDVNLIFFLI